MSAEWQAIPFCLLFSKTRGSIFPVDRKKPNEFFVELINWVFRRLLLACLPCVKTHACSYAGIYILSLSVCKYAYVCSGRHVYTWSRLLSREQFPSLKLLELRHALLLKTYFS